jgi:hypothetical protein
MGITLSMMYCRCTPYVSGVLIAGSSLIARLSAFMRRERLEWQLPIPVELFGQSGLRLHQVRGLLEQTIHQVTPAYIVLHAGANDIARIDCREWHQELNVCVLYVKARWPAATIIWSDMLPRLSWRYAHSWSGADNSRKRSQRRARIVVRDEGGMYIPHKKIKATREFLTEDGVHLTDVGQRAFKASLERGLLAILGGLQD